MVIMNLNDSFMNKAKDIVVNYFNEKNDVTNKTRLTKDDVFIVWFCKTLQNWKALVGTTIPEGKYYEVTHNGDKHETYLDVYQKLDNICISDFEW